MTGSCGGGDPGRRGADDVPPPSLPRRALLAVVPEDDWSRELVTELDDEHRRRRAAHGAGRAAAWYVAQVLSPRTLCFVLLMRRRRRVRRREEGRMTGRAALEGLAQDVRYAFRGVVREPRLAVFVALTLGLGIGGTATMFGVADRLFLKGPEHVAAPEELARLYLRFDGVGEPRPRTTPRIPWRTLKAVEDGVAAFAGLTAYRTVEALGEVGGGVRPLQISSVDGAYFDVLGVRPRLGRFPTPGGAGEAVVAHRLWTRALGRDPDILGRTVRVGEATYTVVGVAPEGFTGPHLATVDLWTQVDPERVGNTNWLAVGRLRGGRTPGGMERASTGADAVHRRTDPGPFFQWARDGRMVLAPLGADDEGTESPEAAVARLLLAVVALVLLIACANAVNLLLARVTRRRREVAVRTALGAGRWRLGRMLVAEGVVLALLGGLASLPLAWAGGVLLRRTLLSQVEWTASPLAGRVMVVALATTLAAGVLVGLLPARRAGRADVQADLRSGGSGSGGGRSRGLQSFLATGQVALSAALLVCAGLFAKSFWTLRVTDLGVDAEEVVMVSLGSLDAEALAHGSAGERAAYVEALGAARRDPGVASAALSVGLPFAYNFGRTVSVPGWDSIPELPGGGPYLSGVTGGYFETVGTRILEGRDITEAEGLGGGRVMVVSRSMARLLWPGGSGLGGCVRFGDAPAPCYRVVGVAEDVHRQGYREPPSLQYYIPLVEVTGFGGMALVVRPRRGSRAAVPRLRSALVDEGGSVDFVETATLASLLDDQVRPWRLGAVVLTLASLLATAVSLVGVYGVLSYVVARRRREIGIRVALGASRGSVRGLVLRGGLRAAGAGVALGTVLVLATGPWVQPLLFETSVADPLVLASVATLVVGAAVAASLLPAREAQRVQPLICLKEE